MGRNRTVCPGNYSLDVPNPVITTLSLLADSDLVKYLTVSAAGCHGSSWFAPRFVHDSFTLGIIRTWPELQSDNTSLR